MKKCPTTVHASKITFIAIAYTLVYSCLWLLCSLDPDFIMTKFTGLGLPELGNEGLSNNDTYCCLITGLVLYVQIFVYYQYLKLFWQAIPQEFARTTPGKAAGYSLIPLFHLYWQFHALVGLLSDMNKFLNRYGKPTFAKGLMIFICVYWVCSSLILCVGLIGIFAGGKEDFDIIGSFSIAGIADLSILDTVDFIIAVFAIWYLRNKVMKFMSVCGCEYGEGGYIQNVASKGTQDIQEIQDNPSEDTQITTICEKTGLSLQEMTDEKKCCIDWWQMPWFLVRGLGVILVVSFMLLIFFVTLGMFLEVWGKALTVRFKGFFLLFGLIFFIVQAIQEWKEKRETAGKTGQNKQD